MNQIDQLIHNYEDFAGLPWDQSLAGAQRVWFAVYDKQEERRVRLRIDDFKLATGRAKRRWELCDLTNHFAAWMASHKYRDAYFASPSKLDGAPLGAFKTSVSEHVRTALDRADANTVVALCGIGSLFGIIYASDLISQVQDSIKGRILVFFPGEYANNIYRLLDARDGWNYLAVPITAFSGRDRR